MAQSANIIHKDGYNQLHITFAESRTHLIHRSKYAHARTIMPVRRYPWNVAYSAIPAFNPLFDPTASVILRHLHSVHAGLFNVTIDASHRERLSL